MSEIKQNESYRLIDKISIISLLIFYSGGPLLLFLSSNLTPAEKAGLVPVSFPIVKQLFALSYVFVICLAWPHREKIIQCFRQSFTTVFPLLLWVLCSALWSESSNITLSRSIALIGTSLLGIYIAFSCPIHEQLKILGESFLVMVWMSLFFSILLPNYGISDGIHEGAWRGIFSHKNGLGGIMSLGAPVLYLNALQPSSNNLIRSFYFISSLLAVSLVVLSTSSTGLIVCVAVFLMIVLFQTLKLPYQLLAFFTSTAALCSIALLSFVRNNFDLLVSLFEKDLTLTGRIPLWMAVLEKIQERPLLGYGYGGFWQGWQSEAADIWYSQGWKAAHSHNGLLEITLSLGIIGTVLLLFDLVVNFLRSLSSFRRYGRVEYLLAPVVFSHLIFSNITEAAVLGYNNIGWVIYTFVALTTAVTSRNRDEIKDFSSSHGISTLKSEVT